MNPISTSVPQRQTHIEFFRVFTMFMIVMSHFIYHGVRVNPAFNTFSIHSVSAMVDYTFLQLFSLFTSTGVNCFILISGYFLIEKTEMRRSLFKIWFQTIFYSLTFFCIFYEPETFSLKTFLDNFSPFPMTKYWFVSQYIGLALLAPFLSRLAQNLNQRQMLYLLGIMFILFFDIPFEDTFATGMSLNWFIFLFFTGGYIRRYGLPTFIDKHISKWLTGAVIVCFLIHFTSNYFHYLSSGAPFTIKSTGNNNLTFFVSVFLFAFFIKNKQPNSLLTRISKLAPYTFGIYLCHEYSDMRTLLWSNLLPEYCFKPLFLFGIVYSLAVFGTCAVIDFIREKLFEWSGINKGAQKLGKKLPSLFQSPRS